MMRSRELECFCSQPSSLVAMKSSAPSLRASDSLERVREMATTLSAPRALAQRRPKWPRPEEGRGKEVVLETVDECSFFCVCLRCEKKGGKKKELTTNTNDTNFLPRSTTVLLQRTVRRNTTAQHRRSHLTGDSVGNVEDKV